MNRWIDQYLVAFCFHWKYGQLHGGIKIVLASTAVVRPLVPGANHQVVLDGALPEMSAGVRTDAVERVQLALDVADCVRIFSQSHFGYRAGRQ